MSSQAARKRVQPLHLGSSTSSFFCKPNTTLNEHLPRKRARVSKTQISGQSQPPSTNQASSLFTFTHTLASTLPSVTKARTDTGTPEVNPPGTEHSAADLEGELEDGGSNRARSGKVSGDHCSWSCILTTTCYRVRTKCWTNGFMNRRRLTCITSSPPKLCMIRGQAVFNVTTRQEASINARTVFILGLTVAVVFSGVTFHSRPISFGSGLAAVSVT
jgi:hypothetical protein